ncbi:MAG: hypothetical protein P4M11_04530, partial [Candidatus Pacebacteria bacterium]|nr:hypothetical protein [Candidatus Paceibacterota bacterium]
MSLFLLSVFPPDTRAMRLLGVAACSAVVGSAIVVSSSSHSECQPQSDSSSTSAPAAATAAGDVNYYKPTGTRLAQIPNTPEEIAKYSLQQLADIYDPPTTASSVVAHAAVSGAPLPPNGLAPLELIFTADDTNPMHRHLELLVRTIQDRMCNDLLDMERLGGATIDSIDGVEMNSQLRSMLLSQGTTPGQFRE